MVYTRGQPIASDDLSISQVYLQQNTNGSDDSFGVDHYKFSDSTGLPPTGKSGLHNSVTTPAYNNISSPGNPPTTTTYPIIYAFTPSSSQLPLIQWSGGISGAIPTPLTNLQSPSGAQMINSLANIPMFNFKGMNRAIANAYVFDVNNNQFNTQTIFFTGSALLGLGPTVSLQFIQTGSPPDYILSIKNTLGVASTGVYWTLTFERIQ